jgi:hypothetical protein
MRPYYGWRAEGVDYEDRKALPSIDKHKHGVDCERRLPVPEYMLDAKTRQAVIIRFLELRADNHMTKQSGSLEERAARAQATLKLKASQRAVRLDSLCAEFVKLRTLPPTSQNEQRLQMLQRLIAELDASIRVDCDPSLVSQILHLYYYEKLNSKLIEKQIGLKAPQIRKIIQRMKELAKRIAAGTDYRQRSSKPRRQRMPTARSNSGTAASHSRWHVKRNIISSACSLCSLNDSMSLKA